MKIFIPILSIINQIHSYTYSNQLKLCAFVNYLTENSGAYSDTITYEKQKYLHFYTNIMILIFISYISNKIMTNLMDKIETVKVYVRKHLRLRPLLNNLLPENHIIIIKMKIINIRIVKIQQLQILLNF